MKVLRCGGVGYVTAATLDLARCDSVAALLQRAATSSSQRPLSDVPQAPQRGAATWWASTRRKVSHVEHHLKIRGRRGRTRGHRVRCLGNRRRVELELQ